MMDKEKSSHRIPWSPLSFRFFFSVVLVIIFIWTWQFYGPHVIDDAYITFRFAQNISLGKGIVYNPGERIQGCSTPLYMLILGFSGALGIDIPKAALFWGISAHLGILILLIIGGIIRKDEISGWLAAFAVSTQFVWVIIMVSGMETMIYSLAIFTALLAVSEKKWKWIGPLAGLTCLIRYDGIILAFSVLCITLWKGGKKIFLREILKTALCYAPWIVFSWIYFGSPIPQTVKAKLLINYLSWEAVFKGYRIYLTFIPGYFFWLPLCILGCFFEVKRKITWIVFPFWMGLYLAVFIIKRRPVEFYPWYLVPLFPPVFLFGALGLFKGIVHLFHSIEKILTSQKGLSVVRSLIMKKVPQILGILIIAVLILIQMNDLERKKGVFGADALHRERIYQRTAEVLSQRIKPGQKVYVGELGTLGWFLPQAYIIDSSGLISPEVSEIRKEDREKLLSGGKNLEDFIDGSPDVTLMVIERLSPDFIITDKKFLFIEDVQTNPLFHNNYIKIDSMMLSLPDIRAFQKKLRTK